MISYGSVNIINASIPFVLLPILTFYLSPQEFGLLSLFQLLMVLSLPLLLMNTQSLIIVEYNRLSEEQFKQLISRIVFISLFGFILLETIFYIFYDSIIEYFQITKGYIFYIPFFVLLQAIPTIIPIIFQSKNDSKNYAKYKLLMAFTNFILTITFIVFFHLTWEGRVFGIVGSFLFFTIIGLYILYKMNLLTIYIDIKNIKNVLSFGLPLIPHSIAGVFLSMSDRIFIANMINVEAVGIYSVAFQVASVISIIMLSINQAWAPYLNNRLHTNPSFEVKKNIVQKTYLLAIGMICISLIFMFFVPYLFDYFISEKFFIALDFTRFLIIGFLFQGFYFLYTNYIYFVKKTQYLSFVTIISVFNSALFNYICIGNYGVVGASYAFIITWVIQFILVWIVSNKLYPMPWKVIYAKNL
jgi:O-antigen/teichoic acid export membrane protein